MLHIGQPAAQQPQPGAAFIRETDSQRFETDVLAASMQQPVIVDFWAPWCGPCKQLMPVLEKVVTEAKGAVHMVKVNIDANPELAQVFRVQSVPMVYAFFKGQPVDGFMGAKPESDLRAFVTKLKGLAGNQDAPASESDLDIPKTMTTADDFFKKGEYNDAIAFYSTILDAAPENMEAMAGIAWCLAAQGEIGGVQDILSQLTGEQKNSDKIKGLSFILRQSEEAHSLESVDTLLAKIEKNPKDSAARFDLARHQAGSLQLEQAIDTLVELIRRDRNWQEDKARQYLIGLFDALGPKHPLTPAGRRKLSAVLFS
jgi:putative thioredoxin